MTAEVLHGPSSNKLGLDHVLSLCELPETNQKVCVILGLLCSMIPHLSPVRLTGDRSDRSSSMDSLGQT